MVNHGRITIEFPGHGTFACSLTSATLKARYQSRSKLAHEIVALWPELFKHRELMRENALTLAVILCQDN